MSNLKYFGRHTRSVKMTTPGQDMPGRDLFDDKKFWLSHYVPRRTMLKEMIKVCPKFNLPHGMDGISDYHHRVMVAQLWKKKNLQISK